MKATTKMIYVLVLIGTIFLISGCMATNGENPVDANLPLAASENPPQEARNEVTTGQQGLLDSSPARAGEQQSGLDFSLASDKAVFMLGEPIVLKATLTNQGAQAVEVIPIFDPTYGFARYTVTYPNGNTQRFAAGWYYEGIAQPFDLGAGQSVSDDVLLFYGADGLTFKEQGQYVIVGQYGAISSSPLTIRVDSPQNAGERAAAELMLQDEVGRFVFLGGGEYLTQARENLNRVREEYSESLLAGYANYALGVYYSRDAPDFKANRIRPADLDKAESYLNKALQMPLLPYYSIRSYSTVIQTYVDNNELIQAQEYLREFEGEFRDEPRAEFLLEKARQIIREQ